MSAVTGQIVNDIDIFDVFNFVKKYNGFIIKFVDTKYEATGDTYEKANDKFKSLGIGEVASPIISFNETKFNANCKFKVPGVISIGNSTEGPVFAGASNVVYTYIYRTKNIFYNGENRLSKLGIIIPEEAQKELYDIFSKSLAILEVNDQKVISIVNQLINWKDSKIFEVDVSKLALIAPSKYDNYILSNMELYQNTPIIKGAPVALQT